MSGEPEVDFAGSHMNAVGYYAALAQNRLAMGFQF
jgi:hypothetical protein